jgi:hypothetical protein
VRALTDQEALRGVIVRTLTQIGAMMDPNQGTLLFFFSGHGFTQNGTNYLATFGATSDDLVRDGLAVSEVEGLLKKSRVRRQVMWIDACRNDPRSGARAVDRRSFERLQAAEGMRVLYSSRQGNFSYEDDTLRHGVFTHFLLQGLRGEAAGADGLVTFSDLAAYVSDAVFAYGVETGRMQKPFEAGEAAGDFLLAKASVVAVPVTAAQTDDRSHDRDLLPIQQSGKYGLIDRRTKKIVLAPQYEFLHPYSEGLAPFRTGGKYGYLNLSGRVVIQPQFSYAFVFREGVAKASEAGKDGFIDPAGRWLIKPTYKVAHYFSDGLAHVTTADDRSVFVDRTGREVLVCPAKTCGSYFSEGLVEAKDNSGKAGFLDSSGRWVIAPQFDEAAQFHNGRALVKTGGSVTLIDTAGRTVAKLDADNIRISPLVEELLAVAKSGQWGFVDYDGKWVISPRYTDFTWSFFRGVACVATEDGSGWIDRFGNWIWEPSK